MKSKILDILRKNYPDPVSGVEISSQIGISRVGVWKHIKSLMEKGYEIKSSKKGYTLQSAQDLISIASDDKNIIFIPVVDSTMDKARELAKSGEKDFTVIVAEEQTKGRGRLNRDWSSFKGGLWFTMLLRPEIPVQTAYAFNFAASAALVKTLQKLFKIDAKIKWPNDIYVNNKKISGLLSEMETKGDMVSYLNIGIGININNTPFAKDKETTSIKEITGKTASRDMVLKEFLNEFKAVKENLNIESILSTWKQETSTLGKDVRIETMNEIFTGKAMDIDETGALVILQENGIEKRIIYGDCFYNN